MLTKALFLDRDGVINVNHGYVCTINDFDFIDGIFDLVSTATELGYLVIVITNQAGIARGFYSEEDFHTLNEWMCRKFELIGVNIDRVYFSPFHPTEGLGKYLKDDFFRKPNPGMILEAELDFDIDLKSSVLIGDKISDIQAGLSAGIGKNILFSPEGEQIESTLQFIQISSLGEAFCFLDH
jgi:D-glycero-D-manno-heptose 1,7-bisphosphate phosphatase